MIKHIYLVVFLSLSSLLSAQNKHLLNTISPTAVVLDMENVANWQITHFRDNYSGRKKPHHIADWTNGALYVGMSKFAKMAKNDKYWNFLNEVGAKQNWKLHWRKYMADDHIVGQMYFQLYKKYGDKKMIQPTLNHLDWILKNPSKQPITLDKYKHLERWTWCDALFMAPPLWAQASKVTGDSKYTDFMLKEYEATKQHLFDKEEHLFYRDNSYIGKLDHGKKVFWSRGNGWVFSGLTLLMDTYDKDSKEYAYFKDIYVKMAKKIIKIQTPEGHWAMSLLNQKFYKTPETSGTAFFTFGLAWGINHGILDQKTYEPHVRKAWNALKSYINKDGMLGYVQPIGAGPDKSFKDQTEVYGTGAFLAAGSEVYKLYGGQPIYQIKKPDYKVSPKTGVTRKHWLDMAQYILEGAFSYVKNIEDPLKFPKIGKVAYPRYKSQVPVEKLEGLCRTLFVAAPLLKQNPELEINNIKIADYYRLHIRHLLDKNHPSFIKDKQGQWPGQTLVEFGALAMSFFSIPEVLWDPLTQDEKDTLARKMISYADGGTVPSNWKFFNIFVLSFFKEQGYTVNEALLEKYLHKTVQHYRGDGWYNDNPAYDYYSMWAFQMYGPYWSEVFGKKHYPKIAASFKNNFLDIKNTYPNMFSKDGKMIMWGRSISYRIASISPYPLLGFYPEETRDVNWGWMRRISSGVLLQFLQHPEFIKDGVPTLGFYGSFDPAVQPYSCRGSVYWMGKAFLSLLLPEDNIFWNEEENDGEWNGEIAQAKVKNSFYKGSKIMVTNYAGIGASEIRAWCNVPTTKTKEAFRYSESYHKLSYNSAFPWQANGKNGEVSMNYMFETKKQNTPYEPGHIYTFKKYENGIYYRDLKSEFLDNTTLHLAELPVKNGIIRVDQVKGDQVKFALGHYALPNINGEIIEIIRKINGKEVHIIDNGEYKLAMVPVYGWESIKTIHTKGLHPMANQSATINTYATHNGDNKNTFVTALLWKKSGEKFTKEELTIKKIKINTKKNKVTIYRKKIKTDFRF